MKIPFTNKHIVYWGTTNGDHRHIFCLGPSKKYTQVYLFLGLCPGIGFVINNNCGGQLGPNTLQIIYRFPFKFSFHSSPYL